jgi:hypothetical protein
MNPSNELRDPENLRFDNKSTFDSSTSLEGGKRHRNTTTYELDVCVYIYKLRIMYTTENYWWNNQNRPETLSTSFHADMFGTMLKCTI